MKVEYAKQTRLERIAKETENVIEGQYVRVSRIDIDDAKYLLAKLDEKNGAKELVDEIVKTLGVNECDDWDGSMIIQAIEEQKAKLDKQRTALAELSEIPDGTHSGWVRDTAQKGLDE